MLTPLQTHLDFGFGATAEAFKEAADRLESQISGRGSIFNEHLPINYLWRHSIELFLKSSIVIIHRKLSLSYGAQPPSGMPHAFWGGKWVPFHKLHSVKSLWSYVSTLFRDHKAFFDSVKRVDWTFPPEVDQWIEDIETHDPKSTFYRYPDTADSSKDAPKAVMSQATPEAIIERAEAGEDEPKQLILLVENSEGTLTNSFYYAGDSLAGLAQTLKKCAALFFGNHVALRSEVCGGS